MKVLIAAYVVCFVALLNLHTSEATPLASPAAAPVPVPSPAAAPEPHKRRFGRFETVALVPVAPVYVQPAPVFVQPAPILVQQPIVHQHVIQPVVRPQIHKEWSFTKTSGFWK